MKRRPRNSVRSDRPELPEGKPMPSEASPNGIEGVDPAWPGGQSNIGEVLNPWPDGAPYSLKDLEDVPRVEVVAMFHCERCGQTFHTEELLNVHRRTAHRRRP